jgi:hypothetical protein
MWWLSFRGGGAAIMNASSLAHTRMLSVIASHWRPSAFVEGYQIDSELAKFLPDTCIGRKLSPAEAEEFRLFLDTNPRKHLPKPAHKTQTAVSTPSRPGPHRITIPGDGRPTSGRPVA